MSIRAIIGFFALALAVQADQIQMQNGDHYSGKVIAMTGDTVVLQSEVLGKITLPRAKVANIVMSPSVTATNAATAPLTNANPDLSSALRGMGANTNFIEMIRKQFLAGAGPAANNKFDELVGGLVEGKFDLTKLRAEAKTAADQIRELKKDGGVGEPMNSYLAILDKFLKESAQTPAIGTPRAATPPVVVPSTNSGGTITIIK